MALGDARGRVSDAPRELQDALRRFVDAQHDGGINDVLTGRPEMDIARRLAGHLAGQFAHEGIASVPASRLDGKAPRVELRFGAGAHDRSACSRGTARDCTARAASKRAIAARNARPKALRRCAVGKDELEAQKSKKTVSFLPCSTTFHSSAPSARFFAISVGRRSTGTRASTGSSALAGSSAK